MKFDFNRMIKYLFYYTYVSIAEVEIDDECSAILLRRQPAAGDERQRQPIWRYCGLRHFVSNVVGEKSMYMGVSSPLPLAPRDRVVLASDGLFDNIAVEDVVATLRKGALAPAVRALGQSAAKRMAEDGHPDDLTMVVFRPLTAE